MDSRRRPPLLVLRGDGAVLAEALTFRGGERAAGRLKVDWLTVQSRRAPDVLPRW